MIKMNYDEVSPITGNKSVLVEHLPEGGFTKMCMDTGFHTYSVWTPGAAELEKFEAGVPNIVKETALLDGETGLVWYKIIMISDKSWLYPDVDAEGTEIWKVVQPTGDIVHSLKNENNREFPEEAFTDALDYFYKLNNADDATGEQHD